MEGSVFLPLLLLTATVVGYPVFLEGSEVSYSICTQQCVDAHIQALDCWSPSRNNVTHLVDACLCSNITYLKILSTCVYSQCGPQELVTAAAATYDSCQRNGSSMAMTEAQFIDSGQSDAKPSLDWGSKIAIIAGVLSLVLVVPTTLLAVIDLYHRRTRPHRLGPVACMLWAQGGNYPHRQPLPAPSAITAPFTPRFALQPPERALTRG